MPDKKAQRGDRVAGVSFKVAKAAENARTTHQNCQTPLHKHGNRDRLGSEAISRISGRAMVAHARAPHTTFL